MDLLRQLYTLPHWDRHCRSNFLSHPVTNLFILQIVSVKKQQHVSVSQGLICSDNCTCCNIEIEVADPTFYLTQSQYTDTRPTSPSADLETPGAWQGSHCRAIFRSLVWLHPEKSRHKQESNPRPAALKMDALTTRPVRQYCVRRWQLAW